MVTASKTSAKTYAKTPHAKLLKVCEPQVEYQVVASKISVIRGQRVMFAHDLAEMHGVETKTLIQAVKRNAARLPIDFSFLLTEQELRNLRSQFVTSSWGGIRYTPYVFSEHGVAMLSSVLRSPRAVEVNIEIMRARSKRWKPSTTNNSPLYLRRIVN
jgi:ORF6N domain